MSQFLDRAQLPELACEVLPPRSKFTYEAGLRGFLWSLKQKEKKILYRGNLRISEQKYSTAMLEKVSHETM